MTAVRAEHSSTLVWRNPATGKDESHQDPDPEEGVVVDEYRIDVDRSTSSDEDAAESGDSEPTECDRIG